MSISTTDQERLVKEFNAARFRYEEYARSLSNLIERILKDAEIKVHSVSYRAKEQPSFAGKLRRPEKNYGRLEEITDLAGIRIITFFAEDVDSVAEVLSREFGIDEQASVDKRVYSDPHRFGYLSLHYVLSIDGNRAALAEYRSFSGLKCEVQVRSILQHAWAEIEHDLGYKTETAVPAELRRRFARISGLLELADDEFIAIKKEFVRYGEEVQERIRTAPTQVRLDLASLRALYSERDTEISNLDQVVVSSANGIIDKTEEDLEHLLGPMNWFDILTVDQLEEAAKAESHMVKEFVPFWMGEKPLGAVYMGIGVFYLLYVLAWRTGSRDDVKAYLDECSVGTSDQRDGLVDKILSFAPSSQAI